MKVFATVLIAASAALSMAQGPCCGGGAKPSAEETFLKQAREMEIAAEGKKACCRTTATVSVSKGDKGCCNAKGEVAKYKVFVAGSGYKFFGCADSAAQGRKELLAKGARAGQVQKVASKTSI